MTDPKSWPDVADKALTGIGDAVRGIAESVEKVAPRAWDALVSYHRAIAIGELCVVVFWLAIAVAVLVAAITWSRHVEKKKMIGEAHMLSLVGVVVFLVILAGVSDALPRTIANAFAPEYPAAMELVEKARGCK